MSSFKRKVKQPVVTSGVKDPISDKGSVGENSSTLEAQVASISLQSTAPIAPAPNVFQTVVPITGWKPWIHTGLGIVSSGHRQLDELLGGGVPLGTTTVHVTENYSAFGQTLFAYNLAEGLSHDHDTLLIADTGHEAERMLRLLPLNQNLEKLGVSSTSEATQSQTTTTEADDIAANVSSSEPNWGLKIAWQYEKYLKKEQSRSKSLHDHGQIPFCCSYDLSKKIQETLLADNLTVQVLNTATESLAEKLDKILQHVQVFLADKFAANPLAVCRVYISSFQDVVLPSHGTKVVGEVERAVVGRFLLRLQRIVRDTRVAVILSVNPTMMSAESMLSLEQTCDAVLSIDSFAGKAHVVPYEFKEFLGFFTIKKLSQCGQLAPYQPPKGSRFGIKRDRRKLHIEPLHLPPEESRAFGSNCSSQDAVKTEPTVSKSFEKIGTVEKKSSFSAVDTHSHAHNHLHTHSHAHHSNTHCDHQPHVGHHGSEILASNTSVVDTAPATVAPKLSLAEKLAAKRQSQPQSGTEFRPVSISRSSNPKPALSTDF